MKSKIHKHPKANSNGFKQNPQNINRSGQNRSLLKSIKDHLFNESEYNYLILDDVELINSEDEPTGKISKVRILLPSHNALIIHYFNRVFKSDRVLMDLFDRVDGKPKTIPDEDEEGLIGEGIGKTNLTPLENHLLRELSAKLLIVAVDSGIGDDKPIDIHSIVRKYDKNGNKL